jgi:hypothetical protein
MYTNTTDGIGRRDTQLPDGPPPHHAGVLAPVRAFLGLGGFVLGLVLTWHLAWRFPGFTMDLGLVPRDGWHHNAAGGTGTVETVLTVHLCFLLPLATALGAACIGSDRGSERALRDWAGAAWIITGILLALDVFALAAIAHPAHSI